MSTTEADERATARAEGIAQGRAEMCAIDAAVIEAARRAYNTVRMYDPIFEREMSILGSALAARDQEMKLT